MAGYYDRDRNPRSVSTGLPSSAPTAMGTMNHPMTHHGNVAEYQVSGIPFFYALTCSSHTVHTITFPFVTQWVQIVVSDSNQIVKVAYEKAGLAHDGGKYTSSGSGGVLTGTNYVLVDSTAMVDASNGHIWRIKTDQLAFISAGTPTVYIAAGLTNVPSSEFPSLSGIIGIGAEPTVADDDGSA